MYIRETYYTKNNKKYTYLKLVKSYRENGKIKQKVIANLGSLDSFSKEDFYSIVKGLSKYGGFILPTEKDFRYLNSYSYGDVSVLMNIWQKVGLKDVLSKLLEPKDIKAILDMLLHRLLDHEKDIGTPQWIADVYLPKSYKNISLNEFYQTMDNLIDQREKLESLIVSDLKYLDNTKILYIGLSKFLLEDQKKYHYPHDKVENYLELLINQQGFPITHSILSAGELDELTGPWILRKYLRTYPDHKVIFIDILKVLSSDIIKYMHENNFKYIIDLKKNRTSEIKSILSQTRKSDFHQFTPKLMIKERIINNKRYIICYDPEIGKLEEKNRDRILNWGQREIMGIKRSLQKHSYNKGDVGIKKIKDLFRKDKNLKRYFSYGTYFDGTIFYERKRNLIKLETEIDGMYFLVTNELDLPVTDIIEAHQNFVNLSKFIETIKDFFKTRPIHHYPDDRIKAHIFLCIMAYILEIELFKKLEKTDLRLSTKQALKILSEIKISENELGNNKFFAFSEIKEEQRQILKALGIRKLKQPAN